MIFDLNEAIDNPLSDIGKKDIYVFGSGMYAMKFIEVYKYNCHIVGVIDNDEKKQGTRIDEFVISSVDVLDSSTPGTYKVIICIKQYEDVLKQILDKEITDIGIYDANRIYPGRQIMPSDFKPYIGADEEIEFPEIGHYHIGYVAGVFDLFHVGHLNLLRRAKQHCDYLVVGVVSDEQVRRNKHKEPYVPFEERLEIIRACRYVDEANEIPINYSGTVEAYEKYHFDAQFSGSDYVNDAWWLDQQKYLREHGSELIFFPYTESTSSTKLQRAISAR